MQSAPDQLEAVSLVKHQKDSIIGIYGGRIVGRSLPASAYNLSLPSDKGNRILDGTPNPQNPYTVFSRINEFLWDEAGNNCVVDAAGIITCSNHIARGDILWMSYGPDYGSGWDPYKTNILLPNLWSNIHQAMTLLPSLPPNLAQVLDQLSGLSLATMRITPGLPALIAAVLDNHLPPEHRHQLSPLAFPPSTNAEQWVEILLTCEVVYQHTAFRYAFDPRLKFNLPHYLTPRPECSIRPQRNVKNVHPSLANMDTRDFDTTLTFADIRLKTYRADAWPLPFRYQSCAASNNLFPIRLLDDNPLLHVTVHPPKAQAQLVSPSPHSHPQATEQHIQHSPPLNPLDGHCLRVAVWNVGKLTFAKWLEACDAIVKYHIDILALLDTRLTKAGTKPFLHDLTRRAAPLGSYHIDTVPLPDKQSPNAGGCMILSSPRLPIHKLSSILPFGSLTKAESSLGQRQVSFYIAYLPDVHGNKPGSLLRATLAHLHLRTVATLREHIHDTLIGSIGADSASGKLALLLGDLNSDVNTTITDRYRICDLCSTLRLRDTLPLTTTPTWKNSSQQSRLDYILINDPTAQLSGEVLIPPSIDSDHFPVLAEITLPTPVPYPPSLRLLTAKDINLNNPRVILAYQKRISCWAPTSTDPGIALEQLSQASAQITQALNHPPVHNPHHSTKNGWSPETQALTHDLVHIILIKRHITGANGYTKWTPMTYRNGLKTIRKRWRRRLRDLALRGGTAQAQDQLLHFHSLNLYTVRYWEDRSFQDIISTIDTAHETTRKLLHGRYRTHWRHSLSQLSKDREFNQQTGRHRQVLNSIMGSKRHMFDLQRLRVDDSIVSDPCIIHETLTGFFEEWFSSSATIPRDDIRSSSASWQHLLEDSLDNFLTRYAHLNIPEHILTILYTALQPPLPSPELELFQSSVMVLPSYDEFLAAIRTCRRGSAGGISGLTYNMVKAWPDKVKELAYALLSECWANNIIPDFWRIKWLVPIPKTPEPTLNDLRPLSLIEVLRKLWVNIFVHRITTYWNDHNTLQPAQHGCTRYLGTEPAVMELASALETAKDEKANLFFTSWDMKRAFDSISKPLQLFAWVRLGIPIPLAEYLVALDTNGTSIIRSPYTTHKLATLGVSPTICQTYGFTARRGAGQGDVASPFIWNAVYDILLKALRTVQERPFFTRSLTGHLRPATDIAYVDDLISLRSSHDAIQSLADIVSGFCCLFGITLSTAKFRAMAIQWGNPHPAPPKNLIIHTDSWSPTEVPMLSQGVVRHLGVSWDMALSGAPQFTDIKQSLATMLGQVENCSASATTKWLCIALKIFPKITYAAKFSAWPVSKYYELDKLVNASLRRILRFPPNSPEALLYLPHGHLGCGLYSLSMKIHKAKLAIFHRAHTTNARRWHTMSSMIARVCRDAAIDPAGNIPFSLPPVREAPSSCWWATSLVQWLQSLDITIGNTSTNEYCGDSHAWVTANETCPLEYASQLPALLTALHQYGIYRTGELVVQGDAVPPKSSVLPPTLHQMIPHSAQPDSPSIAIRPGQVWELSSGQIIEIRGWDETSNINFIYWSSSTNPQRILLKHGTSGLQGAGGAYWASFQCLFPQPESPHRLLLLSTETYHRAGHNSALIHHSLARQPSTPRGKAMAVLDPAALYLLDRTTILYTDGAYCEHGDLFDRMSGRTSSTGAAAMVGRFPNGNYFGIRIRNSAGLHHSAATSELLAQQLALVSTADTIEVHTDYKPGISMRHDPNLCRADTLKDLTYYPTSGRLIKVDAHPERRSTWDQWSSHDLGIYFADSLASKGCCVIDHPDWCTEVNVQDTEVLNYLGNFSGAALIDTTYQGIPTTTVEQRLHKNLFQSYTQQRDAYRLRRGAPPKWEGCSTSLAHHMWRLTTTLGRRAQITRIVWDKHWTGRHRLFQQGLRRTRDDSIVDDSPLCALCQAPLEDQDHIIRFCAHPEMEQIRRSHRAHISAAINHSRLAHPHLHASLSAYNALALHHPRGAELWTGLLTPRTMVELELVPEFHRACSPRVFSTFVSYLRLYAAATLHLYSVRTTLLATMTAPLHSPWNPPREHRSHIPSVQIAHETVIGIDPTLFLNKDGLPLGRRSTKRRPQSRRATLTSKNSEALRQGYCLRKPNHHQYTSRPTQQSSVRPPIGFNPRTHEHQPRAGIG
jgi:hypothetical protein